MTAFDLKEWWNKYLSNIIDFTLCKYIKFATLEPHLILLNKNFDQFIFIFFKECFLKRALFRLENYPQFSSLFLCCQRYLLQDTKRNALDISEFRSQVHHINVLGSRWQIRLDRLRVIIYINFGSSQPLFLF